MLRYWIWLSQLRGISKQEIVTMLSHFPSPEAVFHADHAQLRLAGLSEKGCRAIEENRSLEKASEILLHCYERNVRILTWQDSQYPERLRNIASPPLVLYYIGTLPLFDHEIAITVVGTRKYSLYGLQIARKLGNQIASSGGLVISGMAEGSDSSAMMGALMAERPVVAVLGCGVDVIYPRKQASLYREVAKHGCILSEYPPGTPPIGSHFPVRNRIMSGLSLGVVVVEAPRKSGALITAHEALEQGRDVFAVPGNLDAVNSEGPNYLIGEGATLVRNGWDVVQTYEAWFPDKILRGKRSFDLQLNVPEVQSVQREIAEREQKEKQAPAKSPKKRTSASADGSDSEKKWIDIPKDKDYIDLHEIEPLVPADEKAVLRLLADGAQLIDDVIENSGLPASRVLAAITMLEVRRYITRLPGKKIQLAEK